MKNDGRLIARNSDFRRLMGGETVSELGNTIGSFALPLAILQTAGSTTAAALGAAAGSAGALLGSILAGAWVDRRSPRSVMVVTSLVRLTTWTLMAVVLLVMNASMWLVVPLAAAGGFAASLFGPALFVALREVVGTRDFPRAMATIEGRDAAVDVIGAPLGGVLFGFGAVVPFFVNAVSFLASVLAVLSVRKPLTTPENDERGSLLASAAEGYRYVWSRGTYRFVVMTATLSNFGTNAFLFALIVTLRDQGRAGWQIGLVSTGIAIATLVGAAMVGPLLDRLGLGVPLILGTVGIAIALLATTVAIQHLVVALPLLSLGFLLVPVGNAAHQTYVVATTPAHYQGRVTAFEQFLTRALIPAAPIAASLLIEGWGPVTSLGGLAMVVALAGLARGSCRQVRELPSASTLATQQADGDAACVAQ